MPYKPDREWESSYHPQVLSILNTLMPHLAVLEIASDEKDKSCATDFTMRLRGGDIAVRLRRPYYDYRDLTIRSRRDKGKTELAKIKEGYAFRYFYGWTDEKRSISEWMLVDLDKVRGLGLLEKPREEKPNKDKNGKPDGTYFIWIPSIELDTAGCLLASYLKNKTERKVTLNPSRTDGMQRAQQRSYATAKVEKLQLTDRERNIINSFPVAQEVLW